MITITREMTQEERIKYKVCSACQHRRSTEEDYGDMRESCKVTVYYCAAKAKETINHIAGIVNIDYKSALCKDVNKDGGCTAFYSKPPDAIGGQLD